MLTEQEKYSRCYANPIYKCGPSRLVIGRQFVDSFAGGRYLDVGCGRAELVSYARDAGIEAFGLELVPDLCDGFVVMQGEITEIPFGDRAYDYVSCLDVIEHLPESSVDAALDELFRVTDKTLFITTNDRPSVYDGMELHLTRKPLDWWKARIERAGWSAEFSFGPPHADWQWRLTRVDA